MILPHNISVWVVSISNNDDWLRINMIVITVLNTWTNSATSDKLPSCPRQGHRHHANVVTLQADLVESEVRIFNIFKLRSSLLLSKMEIRDAGNWLFVMLFTWLTLAELDTRLLSIDVKFYQFCSTAGLVDHQSPDGELQSQSVCSRRGERGQTQTSVFLVNIWSQLGYITILARIKHCATSFFSFYTR